MKTIKLGIKKIGYTDRENIMLRPFKNKQAICIDTSIFTFIEHTHLSGQLTSTSEQDKNGVVYNVDVSASMPYTSAADLLMSKLMGGNYNFLIQDMNGNNYLIGTNHFRAEVFCSHEIDGLHKNTIMLTISHKSTHGELIVL